MENLLAQRLADGARIGGMPVSGDPLRRRPHEGRCCIIRNVTSSSPLCGLSSSRAHCFGHA
jgi:hypothetical protein